MDCGTQVFQMSNFKFIDLFAGIGGFHIAAANNGGKLVFASEFNEPAASTYEMNFGEKPSGDITAISAAEIPCHDLLLAGFPCQPFSNAGKKLGFADTRGTLFFEIERILRFHHPKVVLLENVKGFKGHDGGATYRIIVESLNSIGYAVHSKVLNARHFGLPQNRERIFIVGIQHDVSLRSDFSFPEPPALKTKLGNILEQKVDPKYTISDQLWSGHKRRKLEHTRKGNGFGYSLFDESSEYTSTISARYYKDGSEILVAQKGKNPRKITPREAARLQGFPDEFTPHKSDTQAYKQFGNAVPVVMAEAVIKSIVATGALGNRKS
jgi:DNA (cytosine-5)-methyltransferase 1